jgi:CheY-like chemotaxis protein
MGYVLVVEDELTQRTLFSEALERAGYEVLSAPDGREALCIMEQRRPALIFLDLLMPVIGGLAFLRELRPRRAWEIPVVAVTAVTEATAMGLHAVGHCCGRGSATGGADRVTCSIAAT